MRQLKLYAVEPKERNRDIFCSVCHGLPRLCTLGECPYLAYAQKAFKANRDLAKTNFLGDSPPAIFTGQWGYPKVSIGPLVPVTSSKDYGVMDAPELWVKKSLDEILQYRLSLMRGRMKMDVKSPQLGERKLEVIQELAMAESPTGTEVWLSKKPDLRVLFSPREAPVGPSAPLIKLKIVENPRIPKSVEKVVSDIDLRANDGAVTLYDNGVPLRQITRLLSAGVLGERKRRRLVPTEWSITATDDIIGKRLREEVLHYSEVSEYMVMGHEALANNVQVLLMPSAWMFEALETWLLSEDAYPVSDYEFSRGRSSYPVNLAGAYHASRLPILEYLRRTRRQAGAIAFLEVYREWVPLGVWRFRELCREAMKKHPVASNTLEEALEELRSRLRLPLNRWVEKSVVLRTHRTQRRLVDYLSG